MNFNFTTDNDAVIFDNDELSNDSNCGNSFQDYDILRQLGEGSLGKVLRVRSKKNQKIYAMKKVDLNEFENEAPLNLKKEITFLQKLQNRHILKYFKYFEEKGFLYIIIEFMNNGNLFNFMETYQKLNIHLKEEMLWNIFLQSMTALSYIHSMGIIHHNIKLTNLMMDNNITIKLGDFGFSDLLVKNNNENKNKKHTYILRKKNIEILDCEKIYETFSYMDKEILSKNDEKKLYDEKVDVFSMGCAFFELTYFHPYLEKDDDDLKFIKVVKPEDKKIMYSKEILDIINLMLEENINKRPTSVEILKLIQKNYAIKYVRNTSIESVIRCFNAFKIFDNNFIENIFKNNKLECNNKIYSSSLNYENKNWNEYINGLRQSLSNENSIFDGSKEIEPKIVLGFLLQSIHKNSNNVDEKNKKSHLINIISEQVKTSQLEMLIKFDSDFKKSFNSKISQNFLGVVKIQNICQTCNLNTFNFKNFWLVNFDFEKIKILPDKNFQILQGLSFQNTEVKEFNLFCGKCLDIKKHYIHKTYYFMPNCLIINFIRGVNYQIKTKVQIEYTLNLNYLNCVEHSNSPKQFKLVGLINRTGDYGNETYSSFVNENGKWIGFAGENSFDVNQATFINNDEVDVIMLFYQAY